jgi:hypothetical protein
MLKLAKPVDESLQKTVTDPTRLAGQKLLQPK